MKRFLRKSKGVVAFILALVITFITAVPSENIVVNADATDRVSTFIELAKENNTVDLSEVKLTTDELQFLGVYLSNFYVPFGTELGVSEEDKIQQQKENMSKALSTNLSFNESTSDLIVENIINLSRTNNKELIFAYSNKYKDGNYTIKDENVSYSDFLSAMIGNSPKYSVDCGNYGYFGYRDDEGNFIPVFDFATELCYVNDTLTPKSILPTVCQIIFRQCLGSVSIKNGYGFSLFDFTTEEAKNSSTLKEMLENFSGEDLYNMSIYASKMVVDCFGNIIIVGPNHQYVAVPGCMNPYAWISVDSSGEDVSNSQGSKYFLINGMHLGLIDTDSDFLIKYNKSENKAALSYKSYRTQLYGDKAILNGSKGIRKDNKDGDIISTNQFAYRLYRGIENPLVDQKIFGKSAERELVDSLAEYLLYAGEAEFNYDKDAVKANNYVLSDMHWNSFSSEDNPALANTGSSNLGNPSAELLQTMVMIDNLGLFNGDYQALNFISYINEDKKLMKEWGKSKNNGFNNSYSSIVAGQMNSEIPMSQATTSSIYLTYAIAGLYAEDSESKKNTVGKLGYRLYKEGLPLIENTEISIPEEMLEDIAKQDIQNWIYYILHPDKGGEYVKLLITNKLKSLLTGWHNDILGTNNVGATTGTTRYKSNTGYVTTPDLSELQWTSSLIQLYNDLIPFLIVVMLVIMLFAYIAGIMPLQRATFGLIIFSLFLLSPVTLINNVVGLSNRVSQGIYGEKFTYWALVQEESYSTALEEAASKDTYESYLRELYALNSETYSNQGGDSIVLKWQAPKKMASLMLSENDKSTLDSLSNSRLVKSLFGGSSMSGETYLGEESDYLYRSYTDLANYSKYIYDGIKHGRQDSYDSVSSLKGTDLEASLKTIESSYKADRELGYTNVNADGGTDYKSCLRLVKPLSSKVYLDSVNVGDSYKSFGIEDFTGINQDVFNFSLPMFNKGDTDKNSSNGDSGVGYKDLFSNTKGTKEDLEAVFKAYATDCKEKEISGLASYGLMSESVFYYFSWCLYDMGMSTTSGATNGYKDLVLKPENGGFFYNTVGNGELKDFMDMKSLFTYVIPYLKYGNDAVRSWDENFGVFIYEGVPTDEGHWDDADIKNNTELKQKYWHNLNVARLYMVYTPWVDLMYDCSYAKPEKIEVMGSDVMVEDPINPASYPKERPMIFSESEMTDYGLSEADLTEVERKILECNRDMEERMYELLNYYNFKDISLNTAAAMSCAFSFNNEFSENGIFSDNINIYPQSFEISDFSFDAFLRLILANTIGEDLNTEPGTDFYQVVVEKSSIVTAGMYLVVDALSQFALPAFKIFFIMLVFISSILLIIATAFKVDPEQKFINKLIKGVVKPMGGLLIINIGFSWVISLFLGVGNNAVTQSNVLSIQTGDPVIAMLIIAALDVICMVLYFNLIRGVITDIKHNFQLSKSFALGAIGGTFSMVKSLTKNSLRQSKSLSSGGIGGSQSVAENGTGRQSSRATKRASQVSVEDKREKEESSVRKDESRHSVFKQPSKKDSNPKNHTQSINSKIKKGNDKLNNKSSKNTNEKKEQGIFSKLGEKESKGTSNKEE